MNKTHPASVLDGQSASYIVRLQGHLGHEWAAYFEGVSLSRHEDHTTTLYGVVDQAALHSLLRKVRDTGLVLLAVVRAEPAQDTNQEIGA